MEQRHTNVKDMNNETNLRQEKLQELEWGTRIWIITTPADYRTSLINWIT